MINSVNRLETGDIRKLLLEFSIPSIIAMFSNALYNVVDRVFVGQGIGPKALEAVSFAFPVMTLLMAFGMLIGIGSTSVISIRLGRHDKTGAERVFGNAVAAIMVMAFLIPAILIFFLDPLLLLLGAKDPEVFLLAKQFTSVILIGSGFQFFSFGINNIIRADGQPVLSMKTMIFGTAMNMILNPLFIFVFKWGITGSALATVVTQFILTLYILRHFTKKDCADSAETSGNSNLKLRLSNIRLEYRVLTSIFSIGMSPFLIQIAASVVFFIFNKYLDIYGGGSAVAAMGVINSVIMLFLMPIFGINQGAQPIIGYNYGAGEYERVKETVRLSIVYSMFIGTFAFLVVQIFSFQIMSVFVGDTAIIAIGTRGMRIFLCMIFLVGAPIFITSVFQAINKAGISIFLSLIRQVIFLIPLVIVLPRFLGLDGIWIAGPISDIISFSLAWFLLRREMKILDETETAL